MPPALFDGGQFVFQLLADEVRETFKMILAPVPPHGWGPLLHSASHRRITGPAVHASDAAPFAHVVAISGEV